jgi:hypothetical protein
MPRRRTFFESHGAALLALCALVSAEARAGSADAPGAPWIDQIGLTRSTGMAGAMTAFASGNDAIVDNPAGLALNRSYHFQIDGMYDKKFPAEGVMVSIADGTTSPGVGSGMIFKRWGAGQLGGRGEGWLGGVSYAYASGAALFGGTTHVLHFAGPGGSTIHNITQDFGMMLHGGGIAFGATLQNVNFSFENLPLFPLTGAVGFAVGSDNNFHLSTDYKINFANTASLKHQLSFGGEVIFDKTLVLRSGFRWDVSDHLGWFTLGASVNTAKFGFGMALRRRVYGDHFEQALEANITLFLE